MGRRTVDFYAVEVSHGGRYLRRIRDISGGGLLLEDRLTADQPGTVMELELPRGESPPMHVRAEVVRVTSGGQVGLKALDGAGLQDLGGTIDL